MIYTLDTMSRRYGILPSDAIGRATTFDLVIMDAALGYERYQQDRSEGRKPTPQVSTQQMTAMLERVRGRKDQ